MRVCFCSGHFAAGPRAKPTPTNNEPEGPVEIILGKTAEEHATLWPSGSPKHVGGSVPLGGSRNQKETTHLCHAANRKVLFFLETPSPFWGWLGFKFQPPKEATRFGGSKSLSWRSAQLQRGSSGDGTAEVPVEEVVAQDDVLPPPKKKKKNTTNRDPPPKRKKEHDQQSERNKVCIDHKHSTL